MVLQDPPIQPEGQDALEGREDVVAGAVGEGIPPFQDILANTDIVKDLQ
jgi:hypothetical protein